MRTCRTHSSGLAWDWSAAALGATYALPAAVVMPADVRAGLALSVGVLPAAVAGLAPTRRGRLAVVALGALTGVPMFIGGVLHGVPVLAVGAVLLYSDPRSAGARFDERVVETLLGVGLAYVFGLALPAVGLGFEASPGSPGGSRPGGDDRA